MKDCKRVKDPIYGYIKIPAIYMTDIVHIQSYYTKHTYSNTLWDTSARKWTMAIKHCFLWNH